MTIFQHASFSNGGNTCSLKEEVTTTKTHIQVPSQEDLANQEENGSNMQILITLPTWFEMTVKRFPDKQARRSSITCIRPA